jgi:hypothetical protein
MPVVAQINVNFSNLDEIQNLTRSQGGSVQIQDKSVHPYNLARYSLYNREEENFGFDDARLIAYEGGFITAGNRLNVKHSDFQLRGNLDIEKNIYSEFIYSRRKNTGDGIADANSYKNNRSSLPRSITLSPIESEITSNYFKIDTTSTSFRKIDLYTKRESGEESSIIISSTNNLNGERIDITSPTVNILKSNSTTGVVNVSAFVNIANDLKINSDRFIVTSSSGKTDILGNLNIGNSTSYNKFTVDSSTGNTTIAGTLNVTGISTFENSITLNGGTGENFIITNGSDNRFTVNTANGNTTIAGTLNVTGISTFENSITLNGGTGENFIITNGSDNRFTVNTANGNTTIAGTLNVTGAVTHSSSTSIGGTLGVTGITTLSNNATVGGTLGVTGITTLSNNATVGGTLGVTGITTLSNNATVGGTLGVTGITTLSNNATVGGTLGVTGAVTFVSTLNVGNVINLNSTTNANKRVTGLLEFSHKDVFGSTYNDNALSVKSLKNALGLNDDDLTIADNFIITNDHHGKTFIINASKNVNITCPVSLLKGLQVSFIQSATMTSFSVTFVNGTGANIRVAPLDTFRKLAFPSSVATVFHDGSNNWYLFGDLIPV